ncbi:MAG: redoxin domain-containing protein [Deltaproteobacteria bacterium]|nr:redoxin domain-containing protein [Deltaproteobacteria bacterium]
MTHVTAGEAAPDFSLAPGPGPERVTLSGLRGRPVVVLFFPLAFSGVCTEEMCRLAEDWSRWERVGAEVLGISIDSPFVNRKFAQETRVPFPLLSDFNKEAASAYGVLYPEFYGMGGVSKRAAFVVDRDGMVAYAWVAEDADLMPPFEEILAALERLD